MDNYEKKYKDALEWARKVMQGKVGFVLDEVLEKFPELKESEGERVKRILHSISSKMGFHLRDIFTEEEFQCFDAWSNAWLEKQGEQKLEKCMYSKDNYTDEDRKVLCDGCDKICKLKQKPSDKVEQKFHEGDWVVLSTSDGEKVMQIDSIEYFKSGEPRYITSEGRWFGNGTKARLLTDKDVETIIIPESKVIAEQKPAGRVEAKFKAGDIIRLKNGDGLEWTVEEVLNNGYYTIVCADRDDFIQLDDNWELVEQIAAWSKEDEKMFDQLKEILNIVDAELCKKLNGEAIPISEAEFNYLKFDIAHCLSWLELRIKSLRHQNTWKPSDEQFKVLNEVLNFSANHESPHWNDYIFGTLNNLIRQLKKLRE